MSISVCLHLSLNYLVVHLTLTQYYKLTILQFKKKKSSDSNRICHAVSTMQMSCDQAHLINITGETEAQRSK